MGTVAGSQYAARDFQLEVLDRLAEVQEFAASLEQSWGNCRKDRTRSRGCSRRMTMPGVATTHESRADGTKGRV